MTRKTELLFKKSCLMLYYLFEYIESNFQIAVLVCSSIYLLDSITLSCAFNFNIFEKIINFLAKKQLVKI